MSLLRRLSNAARQQGLRGIAAKVVARPVDALFDWRLRVDTLPEARLDRHTIAAGDRQRGGYYEGSRTLAVRAMLRDLAAEQGGGVFVDVGCGKGKVLLLAAQCGYQRLLGVEFSRELCQIARQNWLSFTAARRRAGACQIVEADAAAFDYPSDATVYFFFNPFAASILNTTLDQISKAATAGGRNPVLVFSCMSQPYRDVLSDRREFSEEPQLTRWGVPFHIFRRR